MTHCRQLKFEETPDYSKYRKLFKDLFYRCGFEHEYIFDWTIQRYRVDKPSTSSHDGADENKSNRYVSNIFKKTTKHRHTRRALRTKWPLSKTTKRISREERLCQEITPRE